jgi:hypothetical protein
VAKWVAAAPDLQDARINALLRVTRTKDEDQELEVLNALVSQRPPAVAATATPPPPAPSPASTATPAPAASNWLTEQIDRDAATADRLGWTQKIGDMAAQRMTARQIRDALPYRENGIDQMDAMSIVLSARNKLKIPSQEERVEFEEWIKARQQTASAPAASMGTPPAAPAPSAVGAAGATVTPLVSAPTPPPPPPVVAPAPAPKPPTAAELTDRINSANRRFGTIISRVPTLDFAAAKTALEAISTSPTDLANAVQKFEASVETLETLAVAEAAKIAAGTAQKRQEVATSRAKNLAEKLDAQVAAAADRARKRAEKNAKILAKEAEAPAPPAPAPPGFRLATDQEMSLPLPLEGQFVQTASGVIFREGEQPVGEAVQPVRVAVYQKGERFLTQRQYEAEDVAPVAEPVVTPTVPAPADLRAEQDEAESEDDAAATEQMRAMGRFADALLAKQGKKAAEVVPPPTPADDLKTRLDAVLNPPVEVAPLSFGKIAAMDSELNTQGASDNSGTRTKSRVAYAIRDDRDTSIPEDQRPVYLKGTVDYSKAEGLLRVGPGATKGVGKAVFAMGKNRGKPAERTKTIEPGGSQQVLLEDLAKAGFVPYLRIVFDGEPAAISRHFANMAELDAAIAKTEKVPAATTAVNVAAGRSTLRSDIITTGDAAMTVAESALAPEDAANEQSPAAALAEAMTKVMDGMTTTMLDSIVRRAAKAKASIEATIEGMPAFGRELLKKVMVETDATPAMVVTYVRSSLPADTEIPAGPGTFSLDAKKATTSKTTAAPALKGFDKVPLAALEKLYEVITRSPKNLDGNFDGKELSSGWLDRLNILFERTGMASFDEFVATLDKLSKAAKSPTQFAAALKGKPMYESQEFTVPLPPVGHFEALVQRLRNNGFDVEVIQRELGMTLAGMYRGGKIFVALEDMANANLAGLRRLIHEAGHAVIDQESMQTREDLQRAVESTMSEADNGAIFKAALNAGKDWEEMLVDTTAIKLAEEGFGEKSATIAEAIWRTVKDVYYRVGMAMLRALGVDPSPESVLAWWDNNMRRHLGGDFDFRFTDLFRPHVERNAERVSRFTIADGQDIPDLLDPITGRVTQAEVVPDTVEAAEWNLKFMKDGVAGADMDYTEAMARVTAAAWNEAMPVIQRLKAELLPAGTDDQFWAIFSPSKDTPQKIVEEMEKRVPGAATAKVGGEKMTDAMNSRARAKAFRIITGLARAARKRAAGSEAAITRESDAIVAKAEQLNRADRELRDATAMDAVFNDALRDLIKELSVGIDSGPDTAFAAGKLAGAIREIERLTDKDAIPAEYQNVFKRLLDSGGVSVFDYLSAIARLKLPLGSMKVPDIMKAISENAASDSRLASLNDQRPLAVALSTLARNSTREMDLLQLRSLKDAAEYTSIRAELDEIQVANETRLEEIAKGIDAKAESLSLRDRLKQAYVEARRDFNRSRKTIQRQQELVIQRKRFADVMEERATELSRDVGSFSFWEAHDGAQYRAMTRGDDGKWTATERTLRMVGDEITEQHEQVSHDMAMNRLWLNMHKDQAGSRLYEEVKRQTWELTKLDFAKNYEAATRFRMDRWLQPLGQKFAGTGELAGTKIKQMLIAWQSVMFQHSDQVDAAARRWTKALKDASKDAGYTNEKRFFDEVVNPAIYAIESDPGRDEAGALRTARKVAARIIPPAYTVGPNFNLKLERLLRAHKEVSELIVQIAEKNGVYVNDSRMRDPLTGKAGMLRHAIKYGWFTSTRRLRGEAVRILTKDMHQAGWRDDTFTDLPETAELDKLVGKHFTPTIIKGFVEPFVRKPGREVFFGAKDANDKPTYVSQLTAQELWEGAGGDVMKFIDAMYDRTNPLDNRDALPEYRRSILARFNQLYTMESKLAAKTESGGGLDHMTQKSHRVMDSRTNDLIPPEHFQYDIFSPIDARRALTEVAFHAAFGRDGVALDKAMIDLDKGLNLSADRYKMIPEGTRKEKEAYAKEQGWDFKKLERAADDRKAVSAWKAKLVKHFTGSEAVVGDARTMLELAQLNVALLLNQPKSALWNLLSILEYPLVYRGLNRSSVRATATAARVLAREITGSFLKVAGVNLTQKFEYANEIAEIVERKETERLDFGTLMADIGPDGRFTQGGVGNTVTEVSRGIQTAMRKGFKGNNALWAPFNFISHKADTAIATANVQAFEMMVKRAIDYFERHPEARDNPAFRLTSDHLGMSEGWFSEAGTFDYFRTRAMEYGLGSLEDIAREAAIGRDSGGKLLTRDQALGVAMMALNEISLHAGVNSRLIEMIDNPILRFGGLMLGWPLSKVNQINDAFKDADGKATLASAMRAVGIMAAWTLPAGLAYSLMVDEYDDKLLNKKSNLRSIDPIAITPVVGPLLAAASDSGNILGMLERLARAGTYGIVGDMVNSFTNVVDPSSGQRDFDLNSRVLVFNQFANIRDVFRNLIHQDGEMTYQSTGRPLISAMGGGGLLQAMQLVNARLGLTNAEAAVTNRINVNNYLRAAGRAVDIELRGGTARSLPTARSVWLNQMQVMALSNDRVGFAEAYRNAVDVARRQGEPDPEAKVLEDFKSRHPLSSVFRTKPSEVEMGKLMSTLDDTGKQAVQQALALFESFTELIEPNPIIQRIKQQQAAQMRAAQPLTIEQLRRRAASGVMGY